MVPSQDCDVDVILQDRPGRPSNHKKSSPGDIPDVPATIYLDNSNIECSSEG